MTRKIVQITASAGTDQAGEFAETLYALADDGTLWYSNGVSPWLAPAATPWNQLKPLPQPTNASAAA